MTKAKLFGQRQVREAMAHAESGGQALHVYAAIDGMPNAPQVFKRSKEWGHLFDHDEKRLIRTARRLGVRVIKVHHKGRRAQHIDLCGKPLARAKEAAE